MTDVHVLHMIIKTGNKFVHKLNNGEGILYEVTENLANPLKMLKTLSQEEIKSY